MSDSLSGKKFIFDPFFDTGFLFDMYENDYQYVEEIFTTTLAGFGEDLQSIKAAFASQDLVLLKKAVHKMKPAMGFVGLTALQQDCQAFENECGAKQQFEEIINSYKALIDKLVQAGDKIKLESDRLKVFNIQ